MMKLYKTFFCLSLIMIFFGCGKNEVVDVESTIPKGVSYTKATIGGTYKVDANTEIISAGVCWSENDLPSVNDNVIDSVRKSGTYYFELQKLVPNKTYYARAYIKTPHSLYYGSIREFKTKIVAEGSVLDIDENIYNTVTIGTQTWMVQSLKTSKFRNGDAISYISTNINWANSTVGACCNYENTNANANKYGKLYNWHAINDQRNIAPEGWRVSSESDWQTLIDYLGGNTICGGKLKEQGIGYWLQPNTGATNESGFTARAGGCRLSNGFYQSVANSAIFWTSTSFDSDSSYAYILTYNSGEISKKAYPNKTGLSVRCIKL